MNESALSAAYRRATDPCPLAGDGCPSPDELLAVAAGNLSPERREALAVILANCARCAAAAQIAADFAQPEQPGALRQPLPRRAPRWLPLSLAALLVAALVPGLQLFAPGLFAPDRLTRGDDPAVRPAAGATLAEAPGELFWPAQAGLSCRVVLRSATADVLLQSNNMAGGQLVLEPALRARLAEGEFLWTVDCGELQLGPYSFSVLR